MRYTIIKHKEKKLKALAIYQIGGGVLGIVVTIWSIAQTVNITVVILLIFLVALGLYFYSVLCGILLIKKHRHGLIHSLVNQYLQLISFAILGLGFKYVAGMLFSVGLDLTSGFNMKLNFEIISTWEFNINRNLERIEVNLNLIALFIVIFIDKLRREIVHEETENQLSEFGILSISNNLFFTSYVQEDLYYSNNLLN